MCWVIPPASPAATLALRIASRSVVLPWSTCPRMTTTGGLVSMSFDSSATGLAFSLSLASCCCDTSPRCLISSTKPYFSATFWATLSSIVEFIEANPTIWLSSEISLKGFRLRATAKSRTITGGFRWMILTSPWTVTIGADDEEEGASCGSGRGNDAGLTGRGGGAAAGFGASTCAGAKGADEARGATATTGALATAGGATTGVDIGERGGDTGRGGGGEGAFATDGGGRTTAAALATVSRSRATSCAVLTKIPAGIRAFGVSAAGTGGLAATAACSGAALAANSFSISSM